MILEEWLSSPRRIRAQRPKAERLGLLSENFRNAQVPVRTIHSVLVVSLVFRELLRVMRASQASYILPVPFPLSHRITGIEGLR